VVLILNYTLTRFVCRDSFAQRTPRRVNAALRRLTKYQLQRSIVGQTGARNMNTNSIPLQTVASRAALRHV